jgi:hypothetical protein
MPVFDIETGALPEDVLRKQLPPFDPEVDCPHPGLFDQSTVKYGNAKKEDKRAEILDAAWSAHEEKVANYPAIVEQAREQHWAKYIEKAALDPIKGRVLAVGFKDGENVECLCCDGTPRDEEILIRHTWSLFSIDPAEKLIGHNIFGFDLPFLVKRSWLLGIDVPEWIRNGRYWSTRFVDTMAEWNFGAMGGASFVKLEVLAAAFGIPGKPDGITGADFDRLFHGTAEERTQALEYLENDLSVTWEIADRMQLV